MARPTVTVYLGAPVSSTSNDLFDEPSSWTNISADVKSANWTRGRQRDLDEIQAGTGSVVLRNNHGYYTPSNSSSPYWPLGIRQLKIEATLGSTTYYCFRGWTNRWRIKWSKDWPDWSEAEVELIDLIALLQSRGSSGGTGNASISTRIDNILTNVGFPSGMRSLTGGSTVLDTATGSAWEMIQAYVRSDTGLNICYVDGRGYVIFGPGSDAGVVFGDNPLAAELWYAAAGVEFSLDHVYNDITVTREGGTPQNYAGRANMSHIYGVRTLTRDTFNISDADALTLAQKLFANHWQPKPSIDPIDVEPAGNEDLWEQVLSLEPQDYFTLIRRPPGGGDFTQKVVVSGIATSVDFVGGGWKTTIRLSGQPIMFPSVDLLDTFDRTNEGPPPSSSWTTWWDSGLKVVSNQCAPNDTGGNNAYWNTAMSSPDMEAYVTVVTSPVTDGHTTVLARADATGANGFGAWHYVTSSPTTDDLLLIKFVSGVQSTISGPFATTFTSSSKVGIRCVGNNIELWAQISGIWQLIDVVEEPNLPTSQILDNFNRADEGPPMTGWTAWLDSGLKVVSNQCAPNDSGVNNAYWTTAMTTPDVECYVTIPTLPASGGYSEVWARLDPSATTGYCVNHTVGGGISLNRWVSGNVTTIGTYAQSFSAGDKIGIRCIGSVIEAWVCISGTWSRKGAVIDTANDGTGTKNKLALNNNGNGSAVARYDDFGGGPAFFKGGTYIGLANYGNGGSGARYDDFGGGIII